MTAVEPEPGYPEAGYQALTAFAGQARRDDPDRGERLSIAMDVDLALSRMRHAFRDLTAVPRDLDRMTDHAGALVFQLDWLRGGTTVADVDIDFYALYGQFAERANFVHRTVTETAITYDVVLGAVDPPHTHRLRFHLGGRKVRRLISGLGRVP